jgi:hypothetical protein
LKKKEDKNMSFELLHFRGADKILKKKNMDQVVKAACDYIDSVLYGTLYKGGLLRQALEECDWRQDLEKLKILNGRRYTFKGFRNGIAIDGQFASYEAIWDSLLRLQIGWAQKKIDAGIVLVTGERSEKTPYGSTKELVGKELELLFPTISVPVSIAIFDLGKPGALLEVDSKPEAPSIKKNAQSKGPQHEKGERSENSTKETGKSKESMAEKLGKLKPPSPEKPSTPKRRRTSKSLSVN